MKTQNRNERKNGEQKRHASLKNIFFAIILIVSLTIIVFQLGVWYAYSQAVSNPGTIYGPGDIDAPSYTFFAEGSPSTYYAKNGTTRNIDFSSTDASYVLEQAQATLPIIEDGERGGWFHFRSGRFDFPTTVTLNPRGIYTGEGQTTHIGNEANNTIFEALEGKNLVIKNLRFSGYGSDHISLIHLKGGWNILLENLWLIQGADGRAGKIGVLLEGVSSSMIRNIQASDWTLGYAIKMINWVGHTGINSVDVAYNQFANNQISIWLEDGTHQNVRIHHNAFTGDHNATIYVYASVRKLLITDNYFENSVYQTAIDLATDWILSSDVTIERNVFYYMASNNVIVVGRPVVDPNYWYNVHILENYFSQASGGINITNRASATIVARNNFAGDPVVLTDAGYRTMFANNIGFKTEEYGYASGASPISITYFGPFGAYNGVEVVPNDIVVMVKGTTPYAVSYTTTSTTLTVYHSSAGSIDITYIARYKPVLIEGNDHS